MKRLFIAAIMLCAAATTTKAQSLVKDIQPIVIGADTLNVVVINPRYSIDTKKKVFVVQYAIGKKGDSQSSKLSNVVQIPYTTPTLLEGDDLAKKVMALLKGITSK